MLNRTSMLWTILFAALTLTMAGCLPSGGGGGNNGGGNNGLDLNNGGGNNGGGNNGGGGSCTTGDDCDIIYCNCTDGGVVNARRCDNNVCAPAGEVCPDACSEFGTEWDGTVSTLPDDEDAGSDDAGSSTDTGTSTDTGSDGPQCLDGQLEDTACGNCMDQNCCAEVEGCFESDACVGYLQCLQDGGTESGCSSDFPGGQSLFDSLVSCQDTFCGAECQ
ncbi:MAG: hypothetical protein ACQEVA_02935 [Myxococcota bacterium]